MCPLWIGAAVALGILGIILLIAVIVAALED